ncbi:MAG: TonB-dependent siderophore receptor [Verrucomicrobiaceae bacterium]|nr:MAG: TonB-dependent siderophore receptor [Verrucomicrobiaceae bacterium]
MKRNSMKPKQPLHAALLVLPLTITAAFSQTTPSAPTQLDTLTVTAQAEAENTGYLAPEIATGGLKTPTPLLETPQAVSVVEEQLIKDLGTPKLEEILRNVAGVSPGGYYSDWDYYRIRGFDSAFNTFFDGLRGDYGLNAETFGLERVEVIKGPASTLYGQAPLGGLVNLVSKHPKKDAFGEVGVTVGSYETYEGTVDLNAPLYSSSSTLGGLEVYGRLVGLYSDSQSFIDYVDRTRLYLAPSVTFALGEDTSLTFLGGYTQDDGVFPMPLPAKGTVLPNINGRVSESLFLGLPGISNQIDQSRLSAGYELRHKFNEFVSFRQNFNYSRFEQDWDDVFYNSSLAADERTMSLYPYAFDEKLDRVAVDTALDFKFATGPVKHTLTTGFDYFYDKSRANDRQIDYADPDSYVNIDIFNPDYNFTVPAYASNTYSVTGSESFGTYVQDHAKLTEQVTLTLGGRFDYTKNRADGESKQAFTPKAGLTYEFIKDVAAYANYSSSFKPQWFSTTASGKPVAPEEGENYEAGVKYSLYDGKITGMASVFHLTRSNVATDNPASPDPFDSIVSGEQRSQGFEWENAAELLPGLKISAAYTYLDAEVTEDNTIPEGTPLLGVPEHAINAWVKYTIQEGRFAGLGAGFGGRYYTEQAGDQANSFELPGYGLLDAAIYYEQEKFTAQVNFNNITDKRHFVGSYSDLYVLPGEPFNVSASVTWKF